MILLEKLLLVLLILLLAAQLSCGDEHCQGSNGKMYYCAGFCCPGLGCCSYSSLWYAWVLMALVVLMCLCGCAGCGANRYRYYRRGNGYHNLMSYSSYSNEVSMDRRNRRNRNRQGRSSQTQRTTNYNSAGPTANNNVATETQYVLPQNGERPPPYAAAIPSAPAPPPYSYY